MAASLVPMDGGAPFRIEKPIVLIGRHQECDLPLPEYVKVSRRHCCIVQTGERYLVRDLGSMNGLRVNGRRVNEMELNPGDEISVADAVFVFQHGVPALAGRKDRTVPNPRTLASASRIQDDDAETPRIQEATDRDDKLRLGQSIGATSDSHTGAQFVEV